MDRRQFLTTAGAGIATGLVNCARTAPSSAPVGLEGAPGVELLPSGTALPDYSRDLVNYLVRQTAEARERRQQIVRSITTREQAVARQKTIVKELWAMLGGPLERSPLNPRITGTLQRPGYRIEKVAFESRPRLYVTANLYVPDRPGRRPAVLGPLGHSLTGKAWHTYQKLFANLARKGYVVLAYDPFGQGERIEYPGAGPGLTALGGGGTAEHEYAGRRLILLGVNFGLFRSWDGVRGIDYLLTRPEVDPEKLGCCGQSGGATLTQFLAALDDRIKVAVVSEGNTENLAHENVEPPGSADDAEQNIVPGLARGIDRADLLYAFAPKPLLMTVTMHDAGHTYSPEYVASGIDLLREYKQAYGLFGAADRVSLQATTQSHGYVYEMRRATYAWFNRWFEINDAGDDEPSQAIEPDDALYVTPTGFVTTSFGGETALSLTRQLAATVQTPATPAPVDLRRRIRSVLGIDDAPAGQAPNRTLGRIKKPNYRAEYFEVTSDREIRVPGWLLIPDDAGPSTPTVLYLGEASAWSSVAEEAFAERLCRHGSSRVAVIDVRGRGDLSIAYPERGRHYFPNRITNEAYLTWFTMWLGKPLLGGQIFDVLRVLEYLRSRADVPAAGISIMGDGPHGVLALYAGALDERVRGVVLRGAVTDYRSLAVAERYTQPFGIYAYGLLKEVDLPQVAGALAPRPVLLVNPVTPAGDQGTPHAQQIYPPSATVTSRVVDQSTSDVPFFADWFKRALTPTATSRPDPR